MNSSYIPEEFWSFIVEGGHILEMGESDDQVLSLALERNLEVTSLNLDQKNHLLRFDNDYFDGAVLGGLLKIRSHNEKIILLEDVARIVKPGGLIHFCELNSNLEARNLLQLLESLGFKVRALAIDPFANIPTTWVIGQRIGAN